MIIVNQEKTRIVNFDRVEILGIPFENEKQIACNFNAGKMVLGNYKTEERAKEVLQEIVKLFKNEEFFHIRKSSLNNLDELAEPKYILKPVSRPKVYEMPDE